MGNLINYSNIKEIDIFIRDNIDDLYTKGYKIIERKDINYGTRFKFQRDDYGFYATIYYSKKKGISIVKDQNVNLPEYERFIDILQTENKVGDDDFKGHKVEDVGFNKWIGTDEAGKGDYFGPLVVVGFFVDKEVKNLLGSLGIKDSKVMTDDKVEEVLQYLESNHSDYFSVKTLMPSDYNESISNLRSRGRTFNDLLGICHAQVINQLYSKYPSTEGIIVDQFTHQDKVHHLIKDRVKAKYIQRTKAERDIGVAAASVVARGVFLRGLKLLGKKYGTVFPKGASSQVIEWALEFCKDYGEDKLRDVAKLHFKTTNNILNMLKGQ